MNLFDWVVVGKMVLTAAEQVMAKSVICEQFESACLPFLAKEKWRSSEIRDEIRFSMVQR